ncbi:hypothetical protein [Microbacterium sp. NPDC057944]|uniref:hypothetical protein n=1 Tax=Microbacterium sp. NPDC057944 TaxID=3346286 RepID=UPI0036D7781F
MNVEEVTVLLARIQVLDNRQVDELTIQAWTPLLAHVPYGDAVDAVNAHFQESTDYLQPAHIVGRVRARHRAALPQTMSEEAPENCPEDRHRRLPDGTCLFCTDRREP